MLGSDRDRHRAQTMKSPAILIIVGILYVCGAMKAKAMLEDRIKGTIEDAVMPAFAK